MADWMDALVDVHVYRDGGVWAMTRGGDTRYIGVVQKWGGRWAALAPRGGGVLFEARTRREVLAWIKANPWEVA